MALCVLTGAKYESNMFITLGMAELFYRWIPLTSWWRDFTLNLCYNNDMKNLIKLGAVMFYLNFGAFIIFGLAIYLFFKDIVHVDITWPIW